MRILITLAALALSGCAHWNAMTPEQQKLTVAAVVVGVIVGYNAADDDETVIVVPGNPGWPPPYCKTGEHC